MFWGQFAPFWGLCGGGILKRGGQHVWEGFSFRREDSLSGEICSFFGGGWRRGLIFGWNSEEGMLHSRGGCSFFGRELLWEEGSHSGGRSQLPPPCRGGKICLSDHFKPLWARNVPKFGLAHLMALGVSVWGAGGVGGVPVSHPLRIGGGGDLEGCSLCPPTVGSMAGGGDPRPGGQGPHSAQGEVSGAHGGGLPPPSQEVLPSPNPLPPSFCAPSAFPINSAALTMPLCCSGAPTHGGNPQTLGSLGSLFA